jgi:iron complex transport system substrate-binding protein
MRIVSLIASASEIVHALGLGDFQVGRSHECDYPERVKSLPVCTRPRFAVDGSSAEIDRLVKQTLHDAGSVYEVFEEELERLAPTHILTQTQCRVCAVSMEDVERAMGERFSTRPRVVALEPNSLADIWSDILRVGEACGVLPAAGAFLAQANQRMAGISRLCQGAAGARTRVACIEWIEPLMAAGNWTPELIDMAAAENLFGEARKHSPWLEWQALIEADPGVIIVAPCGFDIERTRREMYWLTRREEWPELRAVKQARVFLADGNQYFNRPGPRVVETLGILAEILYPAVFAPELQGAGWQRL